MAVLSRRWPFYQAEAAKWLDIQISVADCKVHIIPRNQFISGRAKLFSAKAGPMAVLSTQGPMAVLSKQKQPDGQTSRFQRQVAILVLSRTISLSAAGPSYFQQKQVQWPFYQREAQWPFYQSRSNRMARPPDFSDKLQFWYYPAQSAAGPSYSQQKQAQWPFYQREAQWPFYQSRSNRMARPPDFSDKLYFR